MLLWPRLARSEPKPLDGLLLVVFQAETGFQTLEAMRHAATLLKQAPMSFMQQMCQGFCQELIIDIDVVCLCAMIFHLFEFSLCFGGTGQSFCL